MFVCMYIYLLCNYSFTQNNCHMKKEAPMFCTSASYGDVRYLPPGYISVKRRFSEPATLST